MPAEPDAELAAAPERPRWVEVRMTLAQAGEVVEFFSTALDEGVDLQPWQRELLERLLEVLPDGTVAARPQVLLTPRRGGLSGS